MAENLVADERNKVCALLRMHTRGRNEAGALTPTPMSFKSSSLSFSNVTPST
jgi:hypothetical protein